MDTTVDSCEVDATVDSCRVDTTVDSCGVDTSVDSYGVDTTVQWRIQGGGGVQGVWTPPPSNLNMNIISILSHMRYTFLRSALREVAK